LNAAYEKVSGGLVSMMANAEQWCVPCSRVKEDGVEYGVTGELTYPHTHTPTNMVENCEVAANELISPATGKESFTG
jgi:hypothetical protein